MPWFLPKPRRPYLKPLGVCRELGQSDNGTFECLFSTFAFGRQMVMRIPGYERRERLAVTISPRD